MIRCSSDAAADADAAADDTAADGAVAVFYQDDTTMSDYALDGLKQMMTVKSRVVLPYLVPQVSDLNSTVQCDLVIVMSNNQWH